jgi:hypothetical protein
MSDVIAEETTTLPEGAVISVFKSNTVRVYKNGKEKASVSTGLAARFGNKVVKMTIDGNVSAPRLKQYLDLIVREITRRRGMLSTKPGLDYRSPKDIHEFVISMAYNGMFLLNDAENTKKLLQGS